MKSIKLMNDGEGYELTVSELTLTEATRLIEYVRDGIKEDKSVEIEKEVIDLYKEGHKLQAIKNYKEKTGNGLKESKDYCDALWVLYCVKNNIPT